VEIIETKILL